MRTSFLFLKYLLLACPLFLTAPIHSTHASSTTAQTIGDEQSFVNTDQPAAAINAPGAKDHATTQPPNWIIIPFIALLLMIASGPILYADFWHRYYPTIASSLALFVVGYYILVLQDTATPVATAMEYIQFIALIAALYVASGGILIEINRPATPSFNLMFLVTGAVVANLIGTTGASMLLIRPFIRLNREKIKTYHIIFFIFMISNVGGALTPIGDPPLFLGFLSGIPFFWTLQHNFLPWLVALMCLSTIFYYLDMNNKTVATSPPLDMPQIRIQGGHNFLWLGLIITTVFIDPNIFSWVPVLHYHGHNHSFVRELILLGITVIAYYHASQPALKGNAFTWEPLKEVVLIFIGIFGTMMPALQLISVFSQSTLGQGLITHNTLYWSTGTLSSVLDNAPTYLSFAAASMAAQGANIAQPSSVQAFASGSSTFHNSILQLQAISIAAVFFGAMTYIGNGPNFMVKAIAEQMKLPMPSFLGYILRYSLPILLPILLGIWLLFFAFAEGC